MNHNNEHRYLKRLNTLFCKEVKYMTCMIVIHTCKYYCNFKSVDTFTWQTWYVFEQGNNIPILNVPIPTTTINIFSSFTQFSHSSPIFSASHSFPITESSKSFTFVCPFPGPSCQNHIWFFLSWVWKTSRLIWFRKWVVAYLRME